MALNKFVLYNILIFIGFCHSLYSQESNPFSHLSKEERMKLADKYHDLSQTVYQTSEMHRTYKDSALMAVPDHVEYMERASYSYKKAGEHIKAMEMLNKAVKIDTTNGKTAALEYKAWSMLYFYRDYESTIKDVDKVIEISKLPYKACHGESCLLLKAQAYYQLGEYKQAIETFNYLFTLLKEQGADPKDDFLSNFYLARCYFKLNDFDKSLYYLEEQLAMPYSVKAELNFYAGQIYVLKNNTEKAKQHFLKAKELYLQNDKLNEPYIERFDEIFLHDIELEISEL
ncbi:tetratricopeptide repeat protein [Paenimyroides aestuarii]|uniref:Tetratricopeptide repeat protein n=1 Tax=Paenimyroides aestuarii TaxID=2968490 RepID=A0ABY5NQ65_9FLAO|nr:tetratricopeptide repeat protein [Paenimyroides aestuarii]UUV20629.1 tetratricopeptide repeat protein [Paenimyroides aestuarii]